MCNLHNLNSKNFVAKGFRSPKNLFGNNPEQQKNIYDWFLIVEKSLTDVLFNMHKTDLKNFTREGSSPLLCRKYLRKRTSFFYKIYAHKWLCTAVCGHNIFLVTICWWSRGELNPCPKTHLHNFLRVQSVFWNSLTEAPANRLSRSVAFGTIQAIRLFARIVHC